MVYGVDISKHQSDTTVEQLILGGKTKFAITRASIGSYTEDAKLKIFLPKIQAADIKNSHYCANYSKNAQEAIEEADFICDTIEKYADKVEMPIFFDWEYFSANYIKENFGIETTKELVQSMALAFCKRIQERGYKAGIYLNKDYWDRFYGDEFFKAHPDIYVWYARPGYSKPDKECYLWQYASNDGSDFGYAGNIDKNILMGDFIEGEIEPMKPLNENPCRMYIGFATAGDIKKLCVKINGLGIETEVDEGYILTGKMSKGDQCSVMLDCNALGIDYCEYIVPEPLEKDKEQDLYNEDDSLLVKIIKAVIQAIFGGR